MENVNQTAMLKTVLLGLLTTMEIVFTYHPEHTMVAMNILNMERKFAKKKGQGYINHVIMILLRISSAWRQNFLLQGISNMKGGQPSLALVQKQLNLGTRQRYTMLMEVEPT